MIENQKHIQSIWLTKSPQVKKEIEKMGGCVYYIFSIKGIINAILSKKIVVCYSFLDVGLFAYLFSKNKVIVNLSHGIQFKKAETFRRGILNSFFRFCFLKLISREFDLIISDSERSSSFFREQYTADIEITGSPRADIFYNIEIKDKKNFNILYAPTWRDYDFDYFKGFDFKKFDTFLQSGNMFFYIKLHPSVNLKKIPNFFSCKNIKLSDENITDLLIKSDLLITDYSTIFIDFLLLDRPILFSCFDLKKFLKRRGFYYPYDEITPGPKLSNWTEVFDSLKEIKKGTDLFVEKRKEIKDFFYTYSDGKNSERTFKAIEKYSCKKY